MYSCILIIILPYLLLTAADCYLLVLHFKNSVVLLHLNAVSAKAMPAL